MCLQVDDDVGQDRGSFLWSGNEFIIISFFVYSFLFFFCISCGTFSVLCFGGGPTREKDQSDQGCTICLTGVLQLLHHVGFLHSSGRKVHLLTLVGFCS